MRLLPLAIIALSATLLTACAPNSDESNLVTISNGQTVDQEPATQQTTGTEATNQESETQQTTTNTGSASNSAPANQGSGTQTSTTTEPANQESEPQQTNTSASSEPVTNTEPETPVEPQVEPVTEPTVAANTDFPPWLRIPLHYEILFGQSHIWGEPGDTLALNLTETVAVGATTLKLSSAAGLLPQQLITYYGMNGEYYTAQIQSIQGNDLQLTNPLKQGVFAGSSAWNFYRDGSHANPRGSNAVADYAVRLLGTERLNQGTHVLLGDSWFNEGPVHQRLKHRLPNANLLNRGIGGNTAADLLARFDADVIPHTPDFVWIATGTNDYWQEVTPATYKSNLRQLISRIKAIDAMPVVFDSSVGPLNAGDDVLTVRSHAYVTAIDELLAEE